MNAASRLSVLDWLANGVLLVDRHNTISYVNTQAEHLLSQSFHNLTGQNLTQILGNSTELSMGLRRVWDEGWSPARLVLKFDRETTRNASLLSCDLTLCEMDNDTLLLVELRGLDAPLRTAREEAEDAWLQASLNLVRNLAHEVRNPLGGMRGAAQLLHQLLPTLEFKEYTEVIIGEVDRLGRLMDHLLLPGKSGDKQKQNIHRVTEQVLRLVGQEFPAIILTRDYDPSLPDVPIHADLVTQALLNIVRNAAQAINSQKGRVSSGNITVRTRVQHRVTLAKRPYPQALQIQVKDDGPGIDESALAQIFQPLFSLREGGSGLGLTAARHAITLHGGTVEASSDKIADQTVTRFSILLPFEQSV